MWIESSPFRYSRQKVIKVCPTHAAIATILLYVGEYDYSLKNYVFFDALLALKLQKYTKNETCLYKYILNFKLAAVTGSAFTIF
jgi:hypothetical protein